MNTRPGAWTLESPPLPRGSECPPVPSVCLHSVWVEASQGDFQGPSLRLRQVQGLK